MPIRDSLCRPDAAPTDSARAGLRSVLVGDRPQPDGDRPRRREANSDRHGFTLIEIAVAVSLLGVLFSLTGGLIVRVRMADRIATERQTALSVVENLMERAAAIAKSGGDVRDLNLTSDGSMLLNSRLAMDVGAADEVGMSPVTIQIVWTDAAGQENAPVSLTAWLPNAARGTGTEEKP
jgi:prepilin-type N-terminal cleavage/methylation domain-containing protein